MKLPQLFLALMIAIVTSSHGLMGQNIGKHQKILKFYEDLQDKDKSSRHTTVSIPDIKWNEVSPEIISPDKISVGAILRRHWINVQFEDLKFQIVTEDRIVVHGTVKARQPTECDFISNFFEHTWISRKEELIQFIE